jgi:hypothetical protein
LAQAIDAPFLLSIPRMFVFVALAAWTLTLVGMVGEWFNGAPKSI